MVPTFSFGGELPFTDVPAHAWNDNDVKGANETDLIHGMDSTSFAPDAKQTNDYIYCIIKPDGA